MSIQIPNVGTGVPADQTGDSPWLAMKKVADNFSNNTHAASRLLGTGIGQVPLAKDIAPLSRADYYSDDSLLPNPVDANHLPAGTVFLIIHNTLNMPVFSNFESYFYRIETVRINDRIHQFAYGHANTECLTRLTNGSSRTDWSDWTPIGQSKLTYKTTTASGANVVVDASGKLMRSTSSERYKDILAPLELDDTRYADAMALKPIVYRSTADADNPAYHYYSFSAEELGAYDPAFTLWRDTETVTDENGNVKEQRLAERQAEGININALLAMSHAIAIKQDKIIKALEVRVAALETKTEV